MGEVAYLKSLITGQLHTMGLYSIKSSMFSKSQGDKRKKLKFVCLLFESDLIHL